VHVRECQFRLASGRKCRAAANRHQPFCRHHGGKPAGPPPLPKHLRYSDLSRWRQLGAELQSKPAADIPSAVFSILQCLVDRGPDSTGSISNLTAGRFLRVLLTRLGNVPFPDPDLAPSAPAPPQATPPGPSSWNPEAGPGAARIAEINALLAGFGLPPWQGPWPPSPAPLHQ
jgi:hypothetical protein